MFKKVRSVVLASLLIAGIAFTAVPVAAQGGGTPPAATPPAPPPIVVLLAALPNVRGVTSPSNTISAALTALQLPAFRLQRIPAVADSEAARVAGEREGAALVIWGEALPDRLQLHIEMLRRYKFESITAPLLHRFVTLRGLIGLPDAAELPIVNGVTPAFLTPFIQTQALLATARDVQALDTNRIAGEQLAGLTITNTDAADLLTAEHSFYAAYIALRNGATQTALGIYSRLRRNTDLRPVLTTYINTNIAGLAINQRAYSNAQTLLEAAVDNNSTAALTYINLGVALFRQNQLEQAVNAFDDALQADPQNTYALNNRGWLLYISGQGQEGFNGLNEALAIDPNFLDALLNRATAYQFEGLLRDALRDADRAVSLTDKDPFTYYVRADIRTSLGLLNPAIEDLTNALELDATYYSARVLRGEVYLLSGNNEAALIDFNAAISIDPSNPSAYLSRSKVLLKMRMFTEAALDASQAIALSTDAPERAVDAYYFRGEAYIGLERYAEAIRDFQRYQSTAPQGRYAEAAQARIAAVRQFFTPSATLSPSPSRTRTPTRTRTFTPSVTPSSTITPSQTATATNTALPTNTVTPSDVPSATPIAATQTPRIVIVTATPAPPTATDTATSVPPTATKAPPTATSTATEAATIAPPTATKVVASPTAG